MSLSELFAAKECEEVEQLCTESGVDVSSDPRLWRAQYQKNKKSIVHAYLRSRGFLFGDGGHRGQIQIKNEYEQQWKKKTFTKYVDSSISNGGPWIWNKRRFLLSNESGARVRAYYLMRVLQELNPTSVLEVGCGNGLNLLLAARRLPRAALTGVDVTASGTRTLSFGARSPEILQMLHNVDWEAHDLGENLPKIYSVQASAAALPFEDRTFDVVFTSLALEQMEEIRERAICEIRRVTSGYLLLLEPFADLNKGIVNRLYRNAFDYFSGRITDLSHYGLHVDSWTDDMPSKPWLRTGLVLATPRVGVGNIRERRRC